MRVKPTSAGRCPESVSCGKSVWRIYGAKIAAITAKREERMENPTRTVSIKSFCSASDRRASSGIRTYTETSAPVATKRTSGIRNAA